MATTPMPNPDPAASVLDSDPVLNDETRSALWDVFHGTKDPNELAQKLQTLAVPEDTKQRLVSAKKAFMPAPDAVDPVAKTTDVITKMAQIPPEVADFAEKHPNLLKAFVGAASTPEKGAAAASDASKPAGKGGKASAGKKEAGAAPLALPPRPDGLQHLPPIPEGFKRILSSDSGIHDIPEENVAKAFAIDPRLFVMNP